jgi:hypothetical protein
MVMIMAMVVGMLHPDDDLRLRRDWGHAAEEDKSEQEVSHILFTYALDSSGSNHLYLSNADHFDGNMNYGNGYPAAGDEVRTIAGTFKRVIVSSSYLE